MEESKRTLAKKKFWSSRTPEQRKAHMSMMAKARISKTTKEERTEHSRYMLKIRWEKYKSEGNVEL